VAVAEPEVTEQDFRELCRQQAVAVAEQVIIMLVVPVPLVKDLVADQVLPLADQAVAAELVAVADQLPVLQVVAAVLDWHWQYPEYHNGMPQEQADIPMALAELAVAQTITIFVIEIILDTAAAAITPTQ
jgi:hypothetical protein